MDERDGVAVDRNVQKLLDFISRTRGLDLTSYRYSFVERRLRSRLVATGAKDAAGYIDRLKSDPGEFARFLDELSINVTSFFRDKDVFDAFRDEVVAGLLRDGERKLIRVWSAACASGQEPYSLAMLLNEAVGDRKVTIRIWATDVDNDALDKARQGRYDISELRGVPGELIEKYFDRAGDAYTVKESLKALVRFVKHNLINDPPLKFMDVIFCRHVMIYFSREQQEALLVKFAQGLNSDGCLVVAKVESIWDKRVFVPLDHMKRIYKKAQ